jgi:hypothetical protein
MTNFIDRLLMKLIPRTESIEADEPGIADLPATTDEADPVATADQKAITRISEILTCEEANGRRTLAQHLALRTDFTVANAKAALSAAGREGVAVVPSNTGEPVSEHTARQRHMDAAFAEAFNRAEFAIAERAEEPETMIERMKRNYNLAAGIKVQS